jgi:hypothetical protein
VYDHDIKNELSSEAPGEDDAARCNGRSMNRWIATSTKTRKSCLNLIFVSERGERERCMSEVVERKRRPAGRGKLIIQLCQVEQIVAAEGIS